jgi:hypothetical protein
MKYRAFSGLLDRLALSLFDLLARSKGFRFVEVKTPQQHDDFYALQHDDGFSFPVEIENAIAKYKAGGVRFVAYCRDRPVGTIRLADPVIANRPLELYGVDPEGESFEIQSLVVAKSFRDGSQFVMLGLFRAMYGYSRRHGIHSWISCSTRNVYLTMRRYSREIRLLPIDFERHPNRVTRYLYNHGIFDTCYTMPVASFAPWPIWKKHLRYRMRTSLRFPSFKLKVAAHEGADHRG